MSDSLEIAKLAMKGVTNFYNIPGTVIFDGNVYYHFFNEDETSHPTQTHRFLSRFEIEDQPTLKYDKKATTGKILEGRYEVSNTVEIIPFSKGQFLKGKNNSLVKFAIEISKDLNISEGEDPYLYAIMTVRIKQKKLSNKINVIVHIYFDRETRDMKYNSINDSVFEKQFLTV